MIARARSGEVHYDTRRVTRRDENEQPYVLRLTDAEQNWFRERTGERFPA